jgi:hypothetical protein
MGHIPHMEEIYNILVRKPEWKRPLMRPRCRWEDNIKMDLWENNIRIHLKEIGRGLNSPGSE